MTFVPDDFDKNILKTIDLEPDITISGISRKMGKAYMTVRYRVFDLERRGFLKIQGPVRGGRLKLIIVNNAEANAI